MSYGYEDEYGEEYIRQWEREHPVLDFLSSMTALIGCFAIYGISYGFIMLPPIALVYCILKSVLGF